MPRNDKEKPLIGDLKAQSQIWTTQFRAWAEVYLRRSFAPLEIQYAVLGGAADKSYTNPAASWKVICNGDTPAVELEFSYVPPVKCDMLLFAWVMMTCNTSPYAWAGQIYEETDAVTVSYGNYYAAATLGGTDLLAGIKRNLEQGTEYVFNVQWYPWTTGAGVTWSIARAIGSTGLIGVPCRLP